MVIQSLLAKILNSGKITASEHKRLSVVYYFHYLGFSRSATARACDVNFPFIDLWRKRWLIHSKALQSWFEEESATNPSSFGKQRDFVLSLLADAPRSGAPAKFPDQVRQQIIALALTAPMDHGLPLEKWTHELLAQQAVKQGITAQISSSTIGDFLKSAPLKSSPE
jgi:transposase